MLDSLKTLDLATMPSFFAEESQASRDVATELPADLVCRVRTAKRQTIDALHVVDAVRLIDRLPEPGEAVHLVLKGNTAAAWDVVRAVIELAAPAKCESLLLATLGIGSRAVNELFELLDTGAVGSVGVVCSCYFKTTDKAGDFDHLHAGLTSRGQRCAAVRSHAKVQCYAFDDGRRFVVETSANLRSCRNAEQLTLIADAGLHDFHAAWIDQLLRRVT